MYDLTNNEILALLKFYINQDEINTSNFKLINSEQNILNNMEEIRTIIESYIIYKIYEKYSYQPILSAEEIYDRVLNLYTISSMSEFIKTLNKYCSTSNEFFNINDFENLDTIKQLEKIDIRVLNHIYNLTCSITRESINDQLYLIEKYLNR